MARFGRNRNGGVDNSHPSTVVNSGNNSMEATTGARAFNANSEKGVHQYENLHVPSITLRTIFMTILVAMGGFIFGYDTGQISGFLEMDVFLERFGQRTTNLAKYPTGYYFTNVRSGLIVGLVCCHSVLLSEPIPPPHFLTPRMVLITSSYPSVP